MGKKSKNNEEQKAPDLIQIMTVSLFIILLAFFILLNSLAVADEQRRRVAIGSLMENFGILSGGFSVLKSKDSKITTEKISKITSLLDFADMVKGNDEAFQDLVVTADPKRSIVSIPAALLFEPGKTELLPKGYPVLDRLCRAAKETQFSVDICGYMDKGTGVTVGEYTRRELSALRALAVSQYFIDPGKVPAELMTAYGWGPYRPVASNQLKETRALNQRVDVVIAYNKKLDRPRGYFIFKKFFFDVFNK